MKEKENSEFKPVKLHLKIDVVLHPGYVEGLGKCILLTVMELDEVFPLYSHTSLL